MAGPEVHPIDVVTDDLVRVYGAGARRLEAIVARGLRRGLDPRRAWTPDAMSGDATLRYRAQSLMQARAVLAELERVGVGASSRLIATSYLAATRTVDRVELGAGAAARAGFGTVHRRTVEVMATNMSESIRQACKAAGENVADVFARANALNGALPLEGAGALNTFIGRRADDPWRRVALDVLGEGTVAMDTRREVSAMLERRLVNEGIADALTGHVDRAGRRWPLPVYAEMVARTTTREATSRATINRLLEGGAGIVTISSHPHQADECSDYDGRTFALTAAAALEAALPRLDRMPPFHPRCRHVVTPGTGNLDSYEAELNAEAERLRGTPPADVADELAPQVPTTPAPPAPAPRAPTPPPAPELDTAPAIDGLLESSTPARRPLVGIAKPRIDERTRERLEAQRVRALIDRDPGAPAGYYDALEAELRDTTALERARLPYADLTAGEKRARTAQLRDELGDDALKMIRSAGGRRRGLEDGYSTGALSRADLEEELEELYNEEVAREDRRAARERAAQYRRGSFRCFSCHRFKPRPSAVCGYCGDDPVANVNYAGGGSHGGDYWEKAAAMDRAYNYDTSAGALYGDDAGAFDPSRR